MVNIKGLHNLFNLMKIDKSEFVVKKMYIKHDKILTDYLNEKVNYSSIHYKVLPCVTDKKLIKTKGDFRHEKSK